MPQWATALIGAAVGTLLTFTGSWWIFRNQRKERRHEQLREAHLSFLSAHDLVTQLVSVMVKYLDEPFERPVKEAERALNELETAARGVRSSLGRLKIIETNKNLLELISKMTREFDRLPDLTRAKADDRAKVDDFASHVSDQREAIIKALRKAYPLS